MTERMARSDPADIILEVRGELMCLFVVPLLFVCHIAGLSALWIEAVVVGYAALVSPTLSGPQRLLMVATGWGCTTGFITHRLGQLAFERPDLAFLGALAGAVVVPRLLGATPGRQTDSVPTSFASSRHGRGYALALLGLPLLTVGLIPFRPHLALASDMLVFILLVVIVALVGGRGPAVLAAVAASLVLNFFFTPPLHTWVIGDADNAINLVVFVLVAGLVSWVVDVADRRSHQAAEAAARAENLAVVAQLRSALLTAVGHDLRSPLAVAKAGLSGARSTEIVLADAERADLLVSADHALDRLSGLVDNLLDLSRLQTGATEVRRMPVAVEEVIVQALDQVAVDPRAVVLDLPDELPPAIADAGLLERVLANLIANAQRYSPTHQPPQVRADAVAEVVEVRVIDHGPGVPLDQRERIFEPFQRLGDTSTDTGVGLGLALARGLTEAMGGTVTAEETPGGGLTMVVALEAAPSW